MNRVILIKYGELTTKKGNRNFFINTLYQNIQKKLKKYNVKISKDISRMYIEFNDDDLDVILEKVNQVFGIHAFQVAVKVETDEEVIFRYSKKNSVETLCIYKNNECIENFKKVIEEN